MTTNSRRSGRSLADLARRLKRPTAARRLPLLVLMTDDRRFPDPGPALDRLPRGSMVIYRNYAAAGREGEARRLAGLCRRRGLLLLVAGDPRMAVRVRADGAHLAEHRVRKAAACGRVRRPWPGFLLTGAAHGLRAVVAGRRAGLDALLVSPVFPTASHPGKVGLGALGFAALAGRAELPIYALGGIDGETLFRLRPTRAAGIAAIGGLAG